MSTEPDTTYPVRTQSMPHIPPQQHPNKPFDSASVHQYEPWEHFRLDPSIAPWQPDPACFLADPLGFATDHNGFLNTTGMMTPNNYCDDYWSQGFFPHLSYEGYESQPHQPTQNASTPTAHNDRESTVEEIRRDLDRVEQSLKTIWDAYQKKIQSVDE